MLDKCRRTVFWWDIACVFTAAHVLSGFMSMALGSIYETVHDSGALRCMITAKQCILCVAVGCGRMLSTVIANSMICATNGERRTSGQARSHNAPLSSRRLYYATRWMRCHLLMSRRQYGGPADDWALWPVAKLIAACTDRPSVTLDRASSPVIVVSALGKARLAAGPGQSNRLEHSSILAALPAVGQYAELIYRLSREQAAPVGVRFPRVVDIHDLAPRRAERLAVADLVHRTSTATTTATLHILTFCIVTWHWCFTNLFLMICFARITSMYRLKLNRLVSNSSYLANVNSFLALKYVNLCSGPIA